MGIGFLEYNRQVAVVALGGNAILRKDQRPDPDTQCSNIADALIALEPLLDKYDSFALTHGNGPQVGNDLIRAHAAKAVKGLPRISLADCGANTQGRIGHWIVREMKRNHAFMNRRIANIITHVYVDQSEFSADEFTKYVGPWLSAGEINWEKAKRRGIIYKAPDGHENKVRRVVPSPNPYRIEEIEIGTGFNINGTVTSDCRSSGKRTVNNFFPFERTVRIEAIKVIIVCSKINRTVPGDSGRRDYRTARHVFPAKVTVRIQGIQVFVG